MSETSEVDQVDPYHTSDDSDADPDYSQSSSDSENAVNLQNNNNEVQPIIQKGKKRMRNPEEWVRNQRKVNRNSGKQYINSAGNVVPEKRQGPRCQCKGNCFDLLTELQRDKIFTEFYGMKCHNIQDAFLSSLISANEVKRRRKTTTDNNPKKNFSYTYNIKVGTTNVKVCKIAFCNLFSVHKSRVQRIAASRASDGNIVSKQDMRGKHSNRPNKVADDVVATVREHIESFPPRESHYSRSESQKKYLPAELNVKIMYEMYLKKYEPEQYELLKKKEQTKPRITYDFYYRYFVQHFNLSFGFPRSDTCSTCDKINVEIEATSNDPEKQCILQRKELHLRKAQAFYDDLKEKTQLAETDPTVETLCFDYQQNLPVPLLTTSDIFYARQLWVFNQAFHSCSNKKAVMYMFDETIGKKGCIETVSFLKHYIEKYLKKSVKILHIFTDNCGGQNKNAVVLHFLMSLVKNGTLSKIVHHLPEPGHSFLPCDRDFAQIEKKKRRKELLYLPEEWYSLVESCGTKFIVERVTQDMILDFKSHLDPYFKKSAVVKKKPFTISKYRLFLYSEEHPDKVYVSESHCRDLTEGYPLFKSPVPESIDLNAAPLAYSEKLAIKSKKYESIMPLAKNYIPPAYFYPFYDDLKKQDDENHDSD